MLLFCFSFVSSLNIYENERRNVCIQRNYVRFLHPRILSCCCRPFSTSPNYQHFSIKFPVIYVCMYQSKSINPINNINITTTRQKPEVKIFKRINFIGKIVCIIENAEMKNLLFNSFSNYFHNISYQFLFTQKFLFLYSLFLSF